MVRYAEKLIGQRFTGLTVIARAGSEKRYAVWLCRCECGVELTVRSDRLRAGLKRYCSTVRHEKLGKGPSIEHPLTYSSWCSMRLRCSDLGGKNFKNYGSRGIIVCARWQDFPAFLTDMGERPNRHHTIDRIDVNGSYEPGNCQWATIKQQRRNARDTVFVERLGRKIKLSDLCEQEGKDYSIVHGRLRLGWYIETALSTPKWALRKGVATKRAKVLP